LRESASIQLKDAVVALEQLTIPEKHDIDTSSLILTLDMSNIFNIIDTKTGEIVLINDTASKVVGEL